MGVFSNEDIKRQDEFVDREHDVEKKKIPNYYNEYRKFILKYRKPLIKRRIMEDKNWYKNTEPKDEEPEL